MKIHEYQGKAILRKFNVPTPHGGVATTPDQAVAVAKKLGGTVWVVKSQIHAGGRGKGQILDPTSRALVLDGGVKVAKSLAEVKKYAGLMLKNLLVTIQTGEEGKIVRRVLIEQGVNIAREFYAGMLLDRAQSKNVMMVSTEGGMEIENVAHDTPEKILKVVIDPTIGFQAFQARELAFGLGLSGVAFKNAVKFLTALARAYDALDASMFEINPLVLTAEGDLLALDAKVNLDDNGLFRHPDFLSLRDTSEEDPLEVKASKHNLNYIKLDGNVGCMVNGAGLAMATMDIIKLAGGEPANFLDVGGGASAETTEQGFRIILGDKHVKAILINIFGGIVRCDRIANGVVQAARNINIKVPIVVRLAGTNAEEAAEILEKSGINFLVAHNFQEAAEKVTQAIAA
ncbi:MAG: ADP-forming succinate--CoA ligase subunit beta [Bacteroidota bacterium]|jgi:succinyl-CoA synthetase beta subunit|nr:ADP-forming succinate--CoA ligase subunit beta [Bacteroidota bacterium]